MTKGTKKRRLVIEHLRDSTQIVELAGRYRALQEHIVTQKVESLLCQQSMLVGEGHEPYTDWLVQDGMTDGFANGVLDQILNATDL